MDGMGTAGVPDVSRATIKLTKMFERLAVAVAVWIPVESTTSSSEKPLSPPSFDCSISPHPVSGV